MKEKSNESVDKMLTIVEDKIKLSPCKYNYQLYYCNNNQNLFA